MKQMLTTTTVRKFKRNESCSSPKIKFKFPARRRYQSEKDEEELDDIGVGHRVESAKERVENGDASRQDDADVDVNVHDDADGRSCPTPPQNKGKV
jgi:molybdopterin converting factor small subunit